MAVINSTRQFHNEVSDVVEALEAMHVWVCDESQKVAAVLWPLTARLRDLLDQADTLVSRDER